MKSIKDIENMSLEQLEAVSMDENIAVPEGFAARMHRTEMSGSLQPPHLWPSSRWPDMPSQTT